MPFIPQRISTYTVSELIGFMQTDGITLKDINTLKNLALFSTGELMQFISSGACTFEDMQRCGLHFKKQNEIREKLQLWEIEKGFWQQATNKHTTEAYQEYINAFPAGLMLQEAYTRMAQVKEDEMWNYACHNDKQSLYEHYLAEFPNGKYHYDAESRIRELNQLKIQLEGDLLHDMRQNPWKYTPFMMDQLLHGSQGGQHAPISNLPAHDVASKFVNQGMTISYDTLVNEGVIPASITERDLITPEFELPQINNFDAFPLDRTDIYFLGVPRSGKSSVLAGLFNAMTTQGNWRYIPNVDATGRDGSMAYFNGLVRSVASKKPPFPTAHDTINYINIDVPHAAGTKGTAHLNFVEISGECFKNLADSLGDSREVWQQLGASRVLANNNRKVLFFLLDYNVILGNQDGITLYDQQEALRNALTIFSYDGQGSDHRKGCTMSKVESVGVILTKADLMGTDNQQERLQIAVNYLQENFQAFMSMLSDACRDFGINKKDNYQPYIFTFSLGEFYPGNTMIFNNKDAKDLARNIEHLVPTTGKWNLF